MKEEEAKSSYFSEIVITENGLWGQARIKGRRLAIGDVISSPYLADDLNEILNDFELSLEQVKQAVQYCKIQQCKLDKAIQFCHNCTLRVEQENATIEEEKSYWEIAKKQQGKFFGEK